MKQVPYPEHTNIRRQQPKFSCLQKLTSLVWAKCKVFEYYTRSNHYAQKSLLQHLCPAVDICKLYLLILAVCCPVVLYIKGRPLDIRIATRVTLLLWYIVMYHCRVNLQNICCSPVVFCMCCSRGSDKCEWTKLWAHNGFCRLQQLSNRFMIGVNIRNLAAWAPY